MTGPRGLVALQPRIDQWWLVVRGPGVPLAEVAEQVDAPAHADGPARSGLVAERVGEGLRRVRRGDLVPVVVEQGVQGSQAGGAVSAQDRADRVPQGSTGELASVRVDGRDRGLTHRWRAPALSVGHDRPELRTQEVGLLEGPEASRGDLVDLRLARCRGVQELVAADLEPEAHRPRKAGPAPVGGEASARDRRHRAMVAGVAFPAGRAVQGLRESVGGDRRSGGRRRVATVRPGWAFKVHGKLPGRWACGCRAPRTPSAGSDRPPRSMMPTPSDTHPPRIRRAWRRICADSAPNTQVMGPWVREGRRNGRPRSG